MLRIFFVWIFMAVIIISGCASQPERRVDTRPAFKPTGDPKVDQPKIFELERIVRNNPKDKNESEQVSQRFSPEIHYC